MNNSTSNSTISIIQNNFSSASEVVHIFFMIVDVILAIFYVFILTLLFMANNAKTFSNSYYTLMKGLAVSDLSVMIATFIYMLSDFFDLETRLRILWVTWYFNFGLAYFPSMFLTMAITMNRFVAIVLFSKYEAWFTVYM